MIGTKRKPLDLILRACSVIMAVVSLFLVIISVIFTFGGDAPSFFGKNVYIIKTNAFNLVRQGDAVFVSAVYPEEIQEGNLVIFQNSEKNYGIAEIHEITLTDGIYSFSAASEQGAQITLSQGQIIGKAMQVSSFFGGLISFAKSPPGVLVIAVLPCLAVLLYEAIRAIMNNFKKESDISPVKKQEEVPTFIPRQKVPLHIASAVNEPNAKVKAAVSAYKTTDESDYPLFTAPKPTRAEHEKYRMPTATEIKNTFPLSQKRLNEVIAETKAKKNSGQTAQKTEQKNVPVKETAEREEIKQAQNKTDITAELNDIKRTAIGNNASLSETVRRYVPKKASGAKTVTVSTSALPSLDRLLNDDSDAENIRYDIADILSSLERK